MQVVAIGASAGGIEAFRVFFQNMPSGLDMSVVVILHQSADRKSMLSEIIARWTDMPVSEATEGDPLTPNHVYVIPSGKVATVRQGRIYLRPLRTDGPRETTPIDEFFDSLATDAGDSAVAIVLSGTGHDGALGLKSIKARGGLTIAQGSNGTGPEQSGMPHSAIAAGGVDLIIPVEDMPAVLITALASRSEPVEDKPAAARTDALRLSICEILQARLGHDFSQYKDKTFLRRVQRRMQVVSIGSMSDYVVRLQKDREEVVLLFRDLLIGVTKFFRDVRAFEAVQRVVLPRLFQNKGARDTVRIWVPGCATGEEAYSLAMLLREHMDTSIEAPQIQLFATDIDETAINTARIGRYPATLLEDVIPERRQRFFSKVENTYQVSKEIRDLCTFSTHSLVKDPPFSRMNLVSCRNLLIYMDVDLQAAVIPAFHYSLAPGGVLLLGSAETIVRHDDLFAALEKEHRIFLRRDVSSPPLRMPSRHFVPGPASNRSLSTPAQQGRTDWARSLSIANSRVLERFACPFVVVTEDGGIVHYSSHVGGMLQPALGAPSRNLFDMARRGLRRGLQAVLRTAVENGFAAEQLVHLEGDGGNHETVTLIAEPLPGHEPDRPYLIVFRSTGAGSGPVRPLIQGVDASPDTEMERDLREARDQLQSLNEEHETALEELRSSNEELHSVNEELQSSNEELETSREEIQSVNEELQTVNAQLNAKVDELDRANSDLQNLFESTRVATVFLDQHIVIRAFTPEVGSIYNLIPSDRGRPLTDIVSRISYASLREDVQRVLHTLEPQERSVSRLDGTAHYLLRILPYRSPDSTVDGCLVTFVDVTEIVKAEQHQRLLVDELNHRVKNMLTIVISLASQTSRRSASLEDFTGVFLGRVNALTSAYTLLSRENWSSVQLGEVLEEELRPFVASGRVNIRIEGPPVSLAPKAALALGMAAHELATNAVKHGALSVPDGSVSLTWSIMRQDERDTLILEWAEHNGPPVVSPSRRGFGSMLIEHGLTHDLSGEAKIQFLSSGVHATISVPVETISEQSETPAGFYQP